MGEISISHEPNSVPAFFVFIWPKKMVEQEGGLRHWGLLRCPNGELISIDGDIDDKDIKREQLVERRND